MPAHTAVALHTIELIQCALAAPCLGDVNFAAVAMTAKPLCSAWQSIHVLKYVAMQVLDVLT